MATHDGFLSSLLQAFPGQVHLVARYASPDLGFSGDEAIRIFLPDFHWMSASCLQIYSGGYSFNGNTLLKDGRPMFHTLLAVLETMQTAEDRMEVYQLGDRFDLWREMTKDDADVMAAYRRVRNDAAVSGLASRLDALKTRYIRGNHDAWLAQVETDPNVPKSQGELPAANGNILLTHGHIYDNIERILPDEVKSFFVGLCPKVKPGRHDVGPFAAKTTKSLTQFLAFRARLKYPPDLWPTVVPDGARLVTTPAEVEAIGNSTTTYLDVTQFLHGVGNRDDFEHTSYLTFGDRIFEFEQNHPSDHRVYVIGHTHHARILVDRLPNSKPLVTMDCGGWIENCTVYDEQLRASHLAPSAQVGVQRGNELRIYQLGGALA